jgi:hypothetical protein
VKENTICTDDLCLPFQLTVRTIAFKLKFMAKFKKQGMTLSSFFSKPGIPHLVDQLNRTKRLDVVEALQMNIGFADI